MKCVILGAGKIARGFIGHLLYLSDIPFTFVEKFDGLVELINRQGQYTVNILGNSEKNCTVKGAKAISFADVEDASVLERTAAAAILYDHPEETAWRAIKAEKTNEQILTDICGLTAESEAYQNICRYL